MKLTAVIVTYNRLDKLKNTIISFEKQIRVVDNLIIVNNASNDGTTEFLEQWRNQTHINNHVINLNENIGGSGGFYRGLEMANSLDTDWIWVSDDDAYPERDCFFNLEKFIQGHNIDNIVAISGKVMTDNLIDTEHRRNFNQRLFKICETVVPLDEYNKEYFEYQLFSFVGTAIRADVLKKEGLPKKDFFIYYDDTEYSFRLLKYGKIICVPNIIVHHDIVRLKTKENLSWKEYYGIRNRINFLKRYYPKRYYICVYLNNKRKLFFEKDKVKKDLINKAMYDGIKGNLGKNEIYYPGWKPEINN